MSSNKTPAEASTVDFENRLLDAFSIDDVLQAPEIVSISLRDYLQEMLETQGLVRKEVIAEARINETYGWELFCVGKKKPSRNKLLALAFAMKLNPDQTRRLLRHGEASALYAKDKRDAAILLALHHGLSLAQCDELLFRHGLETICGA